MKMSKETYNAFTLLMSLKLLVFYKDSNIGEYDLLASESIKKLNIFSRLIKSINYLIWGDV